MGKYANFYDGVRKLLDKIADALDPGTADVKTANYQTAVLNSLSRIGDKVGDVVSATLPDASAATDGDTLVVDDGEWTIGSGGGGGTGGGVLVVNVDMQTGVFGTTWDEINTARFAVVPFQTGTDVFIFTLTHIQPYTVTFNCANNSAPFPSFLATADNGSDYPVVQMG